MNITSKSLVGALLLTVAAGSALAQAGYTRDTVAQSAPFAGLPVDPATFDVTEGSIASLGATTVADLNARCDVVIHWPSYYGWGTAAFCQNVLYAQGLIDDPNAPSAELAEAMVLNEGIEDSSSESSSE